MPEAKELYAIALIFIGIIALVGAIDTPSRTISAPNVTDICFMLADNAANDTTSNWVYLCTGYTHTRLGTHNLYNSTTKQLKLFFDMDLNLTDYTIFDLSNNNHNCTNTGASFEKTAGLSNSGAYAFNGIDNFFICSSPSYYADSSNFTVILWIKIINYAASGDYRLIDWDNAAGGGGFYVTVDSSGRMQAAIYNGSGVEDIEQSNTGLVSLGKWVMLAYVFKNDDGTGNPEVLYYVNGSYKEKDDFDLSLQTIVAPTSTDAYFGTNDDISRYLNGSMDNVHIYNYALTAEQIAEEYNATLNAYDIRLMNTSTEITEVWTAKQIYNDGLAYHYNQTVFNII